MKDIIVLKDLEQIKAISQQYRLDIIEAFDAKPKTAKQIAEMLDEPHGRVNYHIKILEKVGIIELVQEVTKYGVVEKYYCPVAYKIIIDSSAVTLDDEMSDSISNVAVAFFEGISRDFYESVQYYAGPISRKVSHFADYFLTDSEAKELNENISKLIDSYLSDKEEPREGAQRHSLATMVFAMPDKE
ncbi:helix-turn-helix domain-containing protein [Fusibacter bizertensis]|jgi:Bacterial regulatory protein, arsR family.|uniref:Helix-turn-helix domain-containing protein n=1 Tax=Fusibacter bizertensis TaxID=1488331 RepID=A0ABT6NEQ4_9FIRM|nr:helix-turn-helix domain-containing protein [Fusibacter bizertensis]MDH8678907.1 helix-turn-helix domain-containing protein [Fusibacter bizertensis]